MENKVFSQTIVVDASQTAERYGSGALAVFATPALIGLMENTAMKMIDLPDGSSSVGISISTTHVKASPVGAEITCTAEITQIDGRKYSFRIIAKDKSGDIIGEGDHQRVVVDIERFMSKIN